jgi:hypothetical protein
MQSLKAILVDNTFENVSNQPSKYLESSSELDDPKNRDKKSKKDFFLKARPKIWCLGANGLYNAIYVRTFKKPAI